LRAAAGHEQAGRRAVRTLPELLRRHGQVSLFVSRRRWRHRGRTSVNADEIALQIVNSARAGNYPTGVGGSCTPPGLLTTRMSNRLVANTFPDYKAPYVSANLASDLPVLRLLGSPASRTS